MEGNLQKFLKIKLKEQVPKAGITVNKGSKIYVK